MGSNPIRALTWIIPHKKYLKKLNGIVKQRIKEINSEKKTSRNEFYHHTGSFNIDSHLKIPNENQFLQLADRDYSILLYQFGRLPVTTVLNNLDRDLFLNSNRVQLCCTLKAKKNLDFLFSAR